MGKAQSPIVLVCLILALSHQIRAHEEAPNSPQDYLNAHNTARAELGVPPLVWNDTLAAYAQAYAQKRSKDCAMQHSVSDYGENLAAGSWDVSAAEAVKMWLDEKPLYDVASNTCVGGGDDCLHYTQVVWSGSERVGCGRARCTDGWTFVTCSYDPPGNYVGERPF